MKGTGRHEWLPDMASRAGVGGHRRRDGVVGSLRRAELRQPGRIFCPLQAALFDLLGRDWRAKWGYIVAILLLYFLFALVPEIFAAFTGGAVELNKEKFGEAAVPLAAALVLMAVEKTKVLNDFERKVRGFLHAFARIPDSVRRTVAQMKSSPFNFTPRAIASLTRRLGLDAGGSAAPANFNALLEEDDLLHTLAQRRRASDRALGAEPRPLRHRCSVLRILSRRARQNDRPAHRARRARSPALGGARGRRRWRFLAPKEIRDLRDRLYAFIACGVHPSLKCPS